MANIKKTTTKTAKVEKISAEAAHVVDTKEQTAPVKREFKADDKIMCRSVTQGGLYMEGLRTKQLYEWLGYGDEIEVEYQDLIAAVRNKSAFVFDPCFIVEDEDFIAENNQLDKFYNERFTVKELRAILDLDVYEMTETIKTLPEGAKSSLKAIASDAVKSGMLDSVRKIKALDSIFETDLNLLSSLFEQ